MRILQTDTRMTPREAGRLGGLATSRKHGLAPCPHCGRMMSSGFYEENGALGGAIGGQVVMQRYGRAHMAEIGRKGGRPRRQVQPSAVDTGEGELTSRPPQGGK